MSSNLSFNNVNNNQLQFNSEEPKDSGINLKGNIIGNARDDLQSIGAGVTSLVGAILGYDKEARQAYVDLFKNIKDDPKQIKQVGDMLLSTYNLTVDDLFEMPLGELTGNIIEGAWEHPLTAGLDIATLASSAGVKLPAKFKNKLKSVRDAEVRIKAAEDVTKSNVVTTNLGEDFVRKIDKIEKSYSPQLISQAFEQIEMKGLKNVPQALKPVVTDLIQANDIYKNFYVSAGVELANPIDMAARELVARVYKVPVSKLETGAFENSQLFKTAKDIVVKNDIRPIFHLEPKLLEDLSSAEEITSNLLKRKFGTMDYVDAGKDLTRKASSFVEKLVNLKVRSSIKNVNKIIEDYNKTHGTNIKTLDNSSGIINNRALNELNQELKKTMLGSGVYLGANVASTTLSILNNFNLGAIKRTVQKLPKFRSVNIEDAKTPLLNIISKVNNKFYKPVAGVDKWLERIGARYIQEAGLENTKYMQSMIPSLIVPTNITQQIMKSLVPFGTYPTAAVQEVIETVKGKPDKAFIYNQIQKTGSEVNKEVQSNIEQLKEVDPTKAVRLNEDNQLVQRSTIVTPIQAANLFLLGEQGDAIQIPIVQFINKLISGKGDPNVFTVDGRDYRVEQGKIKTNQGEFDLLPAISYIARQTLSPLQFYNQVLVPLMSDKYIKDDQKLFNKMISDTQYSNMGMLSKRKVTENAREKLGKRIIGTYEYNYYKPYVTRRTQRKIRQQQIIRRNIDDLE